MQEENLSLVFVNHIGVNHDGKHEYMMYYSDTPETVWAEDFPEQVPSTCSIDKLIPDGDTYNIIKRGVSDTKFSLAQENSCFSMQDCIDGIISLVWVFDDSEKRYYGLQFGTPIYNADEFLSSYGMVFTETIEVNKDKDNSDHNDDSFDEYGALEDEMDDDDLERIYNGEV